MYQKCTGRSYQDLSRKIMDGSFYFGISTIFLNPYNILTVLLNYRDKHNLNFDTPLEEENKLEAIGEDKHSERKNRLSSIPAAILGVSLGSSIIIWGILLYLIWQDLDVA